MGTPISAIVCAGTSRGVQKKQYPLKVQHQSRTLRDATCYACMRCMQETTNLRTSTAKFAPTPRATFVR